MIEFKKAYVGFKNTAIRPRVLPYTGVAWYGIDVPAVNSFKMRNSLGTNSLQVVSGAIKDCGLQNVRFNLGPSASGMQVVRNVISGDAFGGLQNVRFTIEENAYGTGMQVVRSQIEDITPVMYDVGNILFRMQIYLDGKRINDLVTQVTVVYSNSSFHNTVAFDSIKTELYDLANPRTLKGQSRIEVIITEGGVTRNLYFLLEERSGDKTKFSVWGRDITARDNSPYAEQIEESITSPQLASSIAAGLLVESSLTWDIDDYLVHAWEFTGTPIDGVAALANEIGAVVRAQDDGSLIVRSRKKVRPFIIDRTTFDVSFTDANTKVTGFDFELGNGANQVVVIGRQPDIWTPSLSIEESSPIKGTDVHIRAYWEDRIPSVIQTYLTEGLITLLGVVTETITEEQVVFEYGVGETNYPIKSLTAITWYSKDNGTPTFTNGSKTLTATSEIFGIADVTYTTQYQRYKIYGHYVEALLAVFIFATSSSVNVKLITGEEVTVDIGTINANLLSSQTAAIIRGKAEIDKVRYDQHKSTFVTPYTSDVLDGLIARINNADIGPNGNYYIDSVSSLFTRTKMENTVSVMKCIRP